MTSVKGGATLVRRLILSGAEAAFAASLGAVGPKSVCASRAHTHTVVDFVSFGRYQRRASPA